MEVAAALRLVERAREENPHYRRAVHPARSRVLLDAGQLDGALREIEAYQVRWGWADPLIRRAIATRQEDSATARDEWQRVIAAFPDFITAGPRSIGYLWHDDYVQAHLRHYPASAAAGGRVRHTSSIVNNTKHSPSAVVMTIGRPRPVTSSSMVE